MRYVRWPGILLAGAALGAAAWAALAPINPGSRDVIFEIPRGTWARRMAGNKIEILPSTIRLTLGLKDILVLKNMDDVPQIFGPTLMMPGQSFRLPFAVASDYQFACTAHASGQMTVIVEPRPDSAWARFWWRLRTLEKDVRP
ncbi:MAG TPA: hypothetical protein VKP66_11065 [Steroidobacteraceae bacterium]|nr:hypothetical protein [Steroidobacteraceae bacterium]